MNTVPNIRARGIVVVRFCHAWGGFSEAACPKISYKLKPKCVYIAILYLFCIYHKSVIITYKSLFYLYKCFSRLKICRI